MRLVALDLKILSRLLGPMPWLALMLWCSIASVQEPLFFRMQGLDLLWPAATAGADILGLVICGLWSLQTARSYYGMAYRWWSGALALFLACLFAQMVALGSSALLDLAQQTSTPWAAAAELGGRAVLVWLPVGVVASCLAQSSWSTGCRLTALTLAFLALLAMNPVSMVEPMFTFDKLLATGLAIAGTCLLAVPNAWPRGPKNPR